MGGVFSKSAKAWWSRFGLQVGIALIPALAEMASKIAKGDAWGDFVSPWVLGVGIITFGCGVLNGLLRSPSDAASVAGR